MYNILTELYHGNIRITERPLTQEHHRLLSRFVKTSDAFESALSQQQKEDFDRLMDQLTDVRSCYEEETFRVGFCLGARVMLEVMGFDL